MPQFLCPKCRCQLEATASQVGKKVACPDCGEKLVVPGGSAIQRGAPPRQKEAAVREPARKPAAARRPARDEAEPQGSSGVLIWSCVGGGVAALLVVAVVVVMLNRSPKPDNVAVNPTPVAQAPV